MVTYIKTDKKACLPIHKIRMNCFCNIRMVDVQAHKLRQIKIDTFIIKREHSVTFKEKFLKISFKKINKRQLILKRKKNKYFKQVLFPF